MKIIDVFILIPPRALLLDIAGPAEVFRIANNEQNEVLFNLHYAGPKNMVTSSVGLVIGNIEPLPEKLAQNSTIIISGNTNKPFNKNAQNTKDDAAHEHSIIEWLKTNIKKDTQLVSICSGALLAAKAGLLDNVECTTHYAEIEQLRQISPTAKVYDNRLFVEDDKILTSAGVTAGIDLSLYMVAKETSHDVAINVARNMVVYMRRGGGDPQISPWLDGRNHIHPAIHRAQDMIIKNPANNWDIDTVAKIAMTSSRNLSRIFKEHTGMSVNEYINNIRIALAREFIASSQIDIESVAQKCGFSSTRHFRRVWNSFYNFPPIKFRQNQATIS